MGFKTSSIFWALKVPMAYQHPTELYRVLWGTDTPTAPDKLAGCADVDINIHTDSWPPGLTTPFSSYKVKSILFTAKGEGAWEGPC